MDSALKMIDFILNMMDFVLKTMQFIPKMMEFILNMIVFILKMMEFVRCAAYLQDYCAARTAEAQEEQVRSIVRWPHLLIVSCSLPRVLWPGCRGERVDLRRMWWQSTGGDCLWCCPTRPCRGKVHTKQSLSCSLPLCFVYGHTVYGPTNLSHIPGDL